MAVALPYDMSSEKNSYTVLKRELGLIFSSTDYLE